MSREIDERIMTEVMGLPAICEGPGGYSGSAYEPNGYHCCDDNCMAADEFKSFYDPHPREPLCYSTEIGCAFQVVEKLRQGDYWCCIEIKSDYSYVWDVKLTRSESLEYDENYKHTPAIIVTNKSLPMAICLAALEAIQVNK